ncbi:MAG: hypothetical protein PVI43_07625, partial [Candidatus Bathyarchaeota archaeon]
MLSLPTLWLTEGYWRFVFIAFEVLLIVSLYYLCVKREQTTVNLPTGNRFKALVDYFFVFASIILIFMNFYETPELFKVFFAIVVSSFLPGYALLTLISFKHGHSRIETVILSYVISLVATGFISAFLLQIDETQRALAVSFVYLIFSVLPLVRKLLFKTKTTLDTKLKTLKQIHLTEIILLLIIVAFILFSVSINFPRRSYDLGEDINRHYVWSVIITRTPDHYTAPYPLFHLHEGIVQILSEASIPVFQTAFSFMTLVVVLSFYIMSKIYLKDVDSRLPIISTVMWAMFSGFGWLYFAASKVFSAISDTGLSQWELLNSAYGGTYFDVGSGQGSLWLSYRPITAGFTIFFSLLYLLKRRDLSKRVFVAVFSLLVIGAGLIY